MSCCSDVMKPIESASCCTPEDTVKAAAEAMKHSGCGCAPVVENKEDMSLVGVVTERDICHTVAAKDRLASAVSVEEVMHPTSSCCNEDDQVEVAVQKLSENHSRGLPVVSTEGKCCGTVSLEQLGANQHIG
ncbi:MAG: CBS domain-containing protein [Acidobacteria bacterium]|nr:MAG: CBS domain-containing protein [Acidobacteriota bacterium]REJ98263.1 MAG: CBS domain-containing protein [Acidobacteriota bacterium]REK17007.1 MAG: CBS domain-containing protein [Acidobacteriota bacterium]REK42917.1 MAG: CBS domain-containing protein [Acidobacteriota bacterium]